MRFTPINPKIDSIPKADYVEVVDLWEASVRATHHFLPESDIQFFKPLILNQYLDHVDLSCLRDQAGKIAGFLGVTDGKIEMLFIHPAARGQGVGKRLLLHAVQDLGAREVDVNEQNEQAVGFYHHLGFSTISRSPVDGMGKPYPLLHMTYSL
ncbi:MAG: GNAT family N-acetyltransferase [Saprospiraceae bacterium]|nr:GNAT family N-acetyltransferase [Saprospiraceae bacterium]